jgi:hypothetical protein
VATRFLLPALKKVAATPLNQKTAHRALKAAKVESANAVAVVAVAVDVSVVQKMPRLRPKAALWKQA